MRARVVAALVAAGALATSACTTHNIALRKDHRVKITAPASQSTVSLPIALRWQSKDLPPGATFAVFVDRQPMRPGSDFRSLGDDTCKHTPGCPDAAWLADHHVYRTTKTALRLESVPADNSGERYGRGHGHEVTIVLIDEAGRRIGETAFAVDFFLQKEKA